MANPYCSCKLTRVRPQAETTVGRFHAEVWCGWLSDVYLFMGEFKEIQCESEPRLDLDATARKVLPWLTVTIPMVNSTAAVS